MQSKYMAVKKTIRYIESPFRNLTVCKDILGTCKSYAFRRVVRCVMVVVIHEEHSVR